MYVKDTIAAVATPPGEGGIGIVRVSGPDAPCIAARIFRMKNDGGFSSHRFYYGSILDPKGHDIDEGMAVLMLSPRSYTREDVLELHCHGGTLAVSRVLAAVLACGARSADPGEFTRRAFLNGRIDLLQAEAVMDIISARTTAALSVAEAQRGGELSRHLLSLRDQLVSVLAYLEAHLDFADDEVDPPDPAFFRDNASAVLSDLLRLLATFEEGKALREGVRVLLAGRPNVGKSSLLNVLLREDRALVTDIPGTTRDVIEEGLNIRGLPVRILDTAGIRETEDVLERMGVDLALEKLAQADLVLFVTDGSTELHEEDLSLLRRLSGKRTIYVRNKADLGLTPLPSCFNSERTVALSARSGEGMEELREILFREFTGRSGGDAAPGGVLNRERHRDALQRAAGAVRRSLDAPAGVPVELLAADLRDALGCIGEVTGETTPEDILEMIFSRFCIGK